MFGSNNYSGYTPWYSQPATAQPQQQSNGINWVQGEAGAKSFAIAPGQSVVLMDSENDVFYIKSSDASGMPMPLRTFEYSERTAPKKPDTANADYITRDEFEKRLSELAHGKQSIQPAE